MLELGIILGSLLFVFVIGYLLIETIFRQIDPDFVPERKCRIAADNYLILRPMMKFFDRKNCVLFTGASDEIVSEIKKSAVDFAVLECSSANAPESGMIMNHIRATYQPSEPVAKEQGMDVFLLTDRERSLDIYYSDTMTPVVQKMLGTSFITKVS